MKLNSRRIASSLMGFYSAIIGFFHGFFEFQQGKIFVDIGLIYAKGTPCNPDSALDGCWPALSLISSMRITAILAITFSILALISTIFILPKKNGGWIHLCLILLMVLFGAGFVPMFYGIPSIVLSLKSHSTLNRWQQEKILHKIIAKIWIWPLLIQLLWNIIVSFSDHEIIIQILEKSGYLLFILELCILILTVFTSLAADGYKDIKIEAEPN